MAEDWHTELRRFGGHACLEMFMHVNLKSYNLAVSGNRTQGPASALSRVRLFFTFVFSSHL